jgi:hypothetical protein
MVNVASTTAWTMARPYVAVGPRGTMAKARTMAVAGVVVVAAGVVVGALALLQHRLPKAAGPAAAATAPNQAHQVAQALASLATDPQSLVASGAAGQVHGRARRAVPAGSKVAVDEKSWAPDGLGGGTIAVTVTAPGEPPRAYAAVMVSERGRWKVLATFPLTTARVPATSSP